MEKTGQIHWGVLEARGLAMLSNAGLNANWQSQPKKMAPVSDTDARSKQVATQDHQEHQNPATDVMARAQDLENRDLAVRPPPAGASTTEAEAMSRALDAVT